jgi:hypothetical protein
LDLKAQPDYGSGFSVTGVLLGKYMGAMQITN